jgi:DNA-binding NarL/FixJ family response regulator
VIRVLLAEDHRLVRAGLERLLATVDDIEVVGGAADGEEAVALAAETRPDVVLMDLSMPNVDGIEATRAILAANAEVQVVVLTSLAERERILAALDAGAVGYLLKDSEPEQLIGAPFSLPAPLTNASS